MIPYYYFILISAFGSRNVALFSLKNDSAIQTSSFANERSPYHALKTLQAASAQSNMGEIDNIPEFLVSVPRLKAER